MTSNEQRRLLKYSTKLNSMPYPSVLTSEERIDLRYLIRLWAEDNGLDLDKREGKESD